jgi:hypothetical protein
MEYLIMLFDEMRLLLQRLHGSRIWVAVDLWAHEEIVTLRSNTKVEM